MIELGLVKSHLTRVLSSKCWEICIVVLENGKTLLDILQYQFWIKEYLGGPGARHVLYWFCLLRAQAENDRSSDRTVPGIEEFCLQLTHHGSWKEFGDLPANPLGLGCECCYSLAVYPDFSLLKRLQSLSSSRQMDKPAQYVDSFQ